MNNGKKSNRLHEMIEEQEWQTVQKILNKNTSEITSRDESGNTIVHSICKQGFKIPPGLLQKAVDLFELSLLLENDDNLTPLEIACTNKTLTISALKIILDKILMFHPPSSFLLITGGLHRLLHRLFRDRYFVGAMERKIKLVTPLFGRAAHSLMLIIFMLKVAHHGVVEDVLPQGGTFRPLHSAIEVLRRDWGSCKNCIDSRINIWCFIVCLIGLYPKEASEKDGEGRLPLHIIMDVKVMSNLESKCKVTAVKILLKAFPDSVAIPKPNGGEIPLITALQHMDRWRDGICDIVRVDPEVLNKRSDRSRMYPFMHAAVYCSSVDVVYQLLRYNPEIVRIAIPESVENFSKELVQVPP